jgi:FK506-binding nuclear protein
LLTIPKHYQQTMDITVGEHEEVYFSANGTYDIYLTGNFVLPPNDGGDDSNEEDYDSDEMDYDLSPDEDELDAEDDDEEDELDDLDDPRITEVDTDDEPTPRLVEIVSKKGKKRPAESDDDAVTLDELISKAVKPEAATNGEEKLSKKQAKKLKKNDGQAVAAAQEAAKKDDKEAPNSDKKKVQFAKNLELGPTGSPKVEEAKKEAPKPGPKVLNGVTVEDKKVGKGKAAKKGDRIEMRYIGKLKSGKQFDGACFSNT